MVVVLHGPILMVEEVELRTFVARRTLSAIVWPSLVVAAADSVVVMLLAATLVIHLGFREVWVPVGGT
jgi:hypothetical protein